ncbi:MAG: CPBP family intramembrane metalloprotease [Rickettsiaceae bacterium]|nr:MAG: CPBP family intramembrane metalloprotease [Rickettsiaceae bacterium]
MNITYSLLAITLIITLVTNDKILTWLCIITTNLVGLAQDIINSESLSYLILLGIICLTHYNYRNMWGKWAQFIVFLIIAILAAAFSFHVIPGFANELAIPKTNLSIYSSPFVMYLNFDKTMAALIIYSMSNSNALIARNILSKRSVGLTMIYLGLCICVTLGLSILSGYVQYDPKIPHVLWLWIINNLLFVCVAEEIIFRFFLQNELKKWLQTLMPFSYMHIILAAVIFGAAHYNGGLKYILLASICGLFYGNIYNKTNTILYSVLIHFGLNLFHILLFTYPSASVLNISMF